MATICVYSKEQRILNGDNSARSWMNAGFVLALRVMSSHRRARLSITKQRSPKHQHSTSARHSRSLKAIAQYSSRAHARQTHGDAGAAHTAKRKQQRVLPPQPALNLATAERCDACTRHGLAAAPSGFESSPPRCLTRLRPSERRKGAMW